MKRKGDFMLKKLLRPKIWFVLIWLIVIGTQAYAQGGPLSITYIAVEESESRLDLNVYFSVRGADGQPLSNPSISNATIQLLGVNSNPVPATISKPNTPIYVVLLIDGSGSMGPVMSDVKLAARAAIDQAPPNAYFSVVQFDEGITVIEGFTNNHERVKAAISGVASQPDRGTCLYDAVFNAIGRIDRQITNVQEQRAIILFTDGRDQRTADSLTPCSVQTLPNVITSARPTDITQPSTPIHAIGLYDRQGRDNINQEALERLARETYGYSAFGGVPQLDNLFQRIMDGLNSQLVATASVPATPGINQATLSIGGGSNTLPLTAPFSFEASFDHTPQLTDVIVVDNGVDYDAQNERLLFSIGISNAQQVSRLIVRVQDAGGLRAIDDIQVPAPSNAEIIALDITNFDPEREYTIQVLAIDADNQYILGEDQEVLLARPFEMPAAAAFEFEFEIDSVNVEYDPAELLIHLDVSDPSNIQTYSGQIIETDTGSRVYEFEPGIFTSETFSVTLPAVFAEAETQKDYELRLVLQTFDPINGQLIDFEATREFSPELPPKVGWFVGFLNRLNANPMIGYAILAILLTIPAIIIWRNRRAKAERVEPIRPPVENRTELFDDAFFNESPGRREEGFSDMDRLSAPPRRQPNPRANPRPNPTPNPTPQDHEDILGPSRTLGPTRTLGPDRGAGQNGSNIINVQVYRLPTHERVDQWHVTEPSATIGRVNCDYIVTNDEYVSRQHLKISKEQGQLYVIDLNSKVGLRINNQRLPSNRKVLVRPKAKIQLSSKTYITLE